MIFVFIYLTILGHQQSQQVAAKLLSIRPTNGTALALGPGGTPPLTTL